MPPERRPVLILIALAALLVVLPGATWAHPSAHPPAPHPTTKLLLSGLAGGSGSTVDPGGDLFVAEPLSGEVTRVDRRSGDASTYASGLPESIPEVGTGGAMDLVFLHGRLYAIVTLVGTDVGGDDVVGLYRLEDNGQWTVVADIGAFSIANPPDSEFFVPSGVQYAIERWKHGVLVSDGHHNRVLKVHTNGQIREVIAFGNIVPTGLETWGRVVLMSQAGPVPHLPEDGRVVAFRPDSSKVFDVASGAPLLVDVERGQGRLYALSQGDWPVGGPEGSPAAPDTGSLEQVTPHGSLRAVATGLDRPTSMEIVGHKAYVITLDGEIWKVPLPRWR
jgi:hypothetical protein